VISVAFEATELPYPHFRRVWQEDIPQEREPVTVFSGGASQRSSSKWQRKWKSAIHWNSGISNGWNV